MSDTESINSTSTFVLEPNSSRKIPFRDVHSSLNHREYRDARTFVRPTISDGVTNISSNQQANDTPVDGRLLTAPKASSKVTRKQIVKEENALDNENIEDLDEATLLSLPWPDAEDTKPKKHTTDFEKAIAEIDNNLQDPVTKKVKNTKLSNRRNGESRREDESPENAETLFQEELERMYNPPKPGEDGYVNLDIPLPSSTTYTYQVETDSEDERKFEEIKRRQKQEELDRQKQIQERKKAKKNKKKQKKEKVSYTKVVPISISQNDADDKNHKRKSDKKTKKAKLMERATKSAPSNKPILTGVHAFDADDNGDDDEGKVGAFRRMRYGLMRFGRYVRKQITKCSCTSAQITE